MNLLNPAEGERLLARAEVIKPGRTLIVVRADVFGIRSASQDRPVATMLATMMVL